jgi:hypothetical protein
MKAATLAGLAALGVIAASAGPALAQGACGRPGTDDKDDGFYSSLWSCDKPVYMDMIKRFAMDKGDWDGERGWNDCCNDRLPLKRTFNALQLLAYSVTNAPTCNTSNQNVGHWAYCWSGNAIDELDGSCNNDSRANTRHLPGAQRTQLRQPFFYDRTVVERASTVFHEARHAQGWCGHTDRCADGEGSCDPNFNDGCVGFGSGDGPGANAYNVLFFHWFATTAQPHWITPPIRGNAVNEANYFLNRRFEQDPCFRADSNGHLFRTC